LLTFGNDIICYDQLFELAQMSNLPICVRNICNINNQYDVATYRTFHLDLISMCQKDGVLLPKKTGFFVYMFILGSFLFFENMKLLINLSISNC
jgi:hypothetical protein